MHKNFSLQMFSFRWGETSQICRKTKGEGDLLEQFKVVLPLQVPAAYKVVLWLIASPSYRGPQKK